VNIERSTRSNKQQLTATATTTIEMTATQSMIDTIDCYSKASTTRHRHDLRSIQSIATATTTATTTATAIQLQLQLRLQLQLQLATATATRHRIVVVVVWRRHGRNASRSAN
jgi:hypothetical protein